MPPITVTVRLKDAEDITITVMAWQRVSESWTDSDEVRYGETKLATSTTWEAEGKAPCVHDIFFCAHTILGAHTILCVHTPIECYQICV